MTAQTTLKTCDSRFDFDNVRKAQLFKTARIAVDIPARDFDRAKGFEGDLYCGPYAYVSIAWQYQLDGVEYYAIRRGNAWRYDVPAHWLADFCL